MRTTILGDICEVTAGQSAPQDPKVFGLTGKPFIRAGSLENLVNGRIEDECEHISDESAIRLRLRIFPKDTILFAKSGMSAKIGRVYRLKKPSYVTSHLAAVIPGKETDPRYLQRWFEKNPPSRLIPNESYPSIRTSVISLLKIDLPPMPEQKRIAAILDKADAIRRKRQTAIKLADDFLRATFLDMFGDPVTNPKRWEVRTIGQLLADIPNAARTGPFGSQLKHSEFTDEGIPVLGIDNVVTNVFRWASLRCLPPEKYEQFKRYRVFPEDLIITIMGTTGRVAVAPSDLPECMSTKHLCVLTLNKDKIDPVFLWATLLFDNKVRNQAKSSSCGAIMEGWNMGIIKNIDIRVPPIKIQRVFRSIFEKSKRLKEKQTAWEEDSSNLLFSSLIQRAFRGEL
jgi:type I restriction enzyme S subunit